MKGTRECDSWDSDSHGVSETDSYALVSMMFDRVGDDLDALPHKVLETRLSGYL